MNKFLLAIITMVLIQALIGAFTPVYSCLDRYTDYSVSVATVLALLMMLINGTFTSTRYIVIVKFGLGVLILGICFKILHLTGADQMLSFAFLFFFLAYGIHFSKKRPRMLLDYFKFLTMMSFLLSTVLGMFNVGTEETTDVLDLVGIGLFWITFVLFLILEKRKLWAKKISTP